MKKQQLKRWVPAPGENSQTANGQVCSGFGRISLMARG